MGAGSAGGDRVFVCTSGNMKATFMEKIKMLAAVTVAITATCIAAVQAVPLADTRQSAPALPVAEVTVTPHGARAVNAFAEIQRRGLIDNGSQMRGEP